MNIENNYFSPKFMMGLILNIESAIWEEYKSYINVNYYINKWHVEDSNWNSNWENFTIYKINDNKIDLARTLHNIDGETLIKIAIDLGIETPDFIPSVPIFRNELKASYETANATFDKAIKQIEEHPDIAVGLANSALESIIKEILKDERIKSKINSKATLYSLAQSVLKELLLFPDSNTPKEIKTIGSSLLSVTQSIEDLRSGKTNLHGKTKTDYVIDDPIYAYFIINSITTIGLFLQSFYRKKYPKIEPETEVEDYGDDLPF